MTAVCGAVSFGWSGGDHVLDTSFDLAKNVVNDALHLALRVDTDKVPGAPGFPSRRIGDSRRPAGHSRKSTGSIHRTRLGPKPGSASVVARTDDPAS